MPVGDATTVPSTVCVAGKLPTVTVPSTVYVPFGVAVTVPETGTPTPPEIPWIVTTPVSAVPATPRPVTVCVPPDVAVRLPVTV